MTNILLIDIQNGVHTRIHQTNGGTRKLPITEDVAYYFCAIMR